MPCPSSLLRTAGAAFAEGAPGARSHSFMWRCTTTTGCIGLMRQGWQRRMFGILMPPRV